MAIPRTEVVSALNGKTLKLSNFDNLNKGWPTALSPHLLWIREEASKRLREIVSQRPNITDQEKLIKKLIGADFGLFAATWWPFESLEVLQIMVQMVVWLFLWDDEIDCHDSRYGNDFDPAQTYREYTLAFVAQSLGLSTSPIEMNEHHPDHSTNFLITSFQSIADAIAHRDEAHRTRLYHEIEYFIRATETEQQRRLHADLPSVEEYMKCRMGTSAVYVLFALIEMPVGLLKDTTVSSEMRKIEFEANVIISISNDMFSLKKELAAGTPDSLIPILWQSNKSLSDAMATAMEMLYEARERFDEAETRLRRACPSSSMSDIEQFLTIAKTNCTGNILWSVNTQRYGFDTDRLENGEIQIEL